MKKPKGIFDIAEGTVGKFAKQLSLKQKMIRIGIFQIINVFCH